MKLQELEIMIENLGMSFTIEKKLLFMDIGQQID